MRPEAVQSISVPPLWRNFGLIACVGSLAITALYLLRQFALGTDFTDAPLVLFVTLNTCVVFTLGAYFASDLAEMLLHLPKSDEVKDLSLQERVNRILAHPTAAAFGVFYAVLLGYLASTVAPWPPDSPLHRWFGMVIFANNLMIGFALWAILRYWLGFLQVLPIVPLNVLNLSREPLPAFLRFNSRVVLLAAFVGSMAILGFALSSYKTSPPILMFSVFAFIVVGATYAVPIIPLSNRLRRLKAEELDKIETGISAHVHALSDPAISTKGIPPLSDLREAQQIVASIKTLPPGGQISVSATAIVTGLSFLPAAVQYVTQMMSN